MTRFRFALLVLVGLSLAIGMPAFAGAQVKREAARPINSIAGVDLYNAYCAVCHGKDGKGAGPAATAMKMPMPDLTQIAKKHGGSYPVAAVEQAITGAGKVSPAHGSADMPIWGPVFKAMGSDESSLKLRVNNLVTYIESLQQ